MPITLNNAARQYLGYCQHTKNLSSLTIDAYYHDLESFKNVIGKRRRIENIGKADVYTFVDALYLEGRASTTVKRRVACLKSFFKWFEQDNRNWVNPFSKLELKIALPKRMPRHLSLCELTSMAKMARKHSEYLMRQYLRSGKRSLNHDGSGGRSNTMLYSMGMRKTSENVAYIWGDAGDVAMRFSRDWINSKKHKFNILGHWDFTGVGIAKCPDGTIFATQLFALEDDFENF